MNCLRLPIINSIKYSSRTLTSKAKGGGSKSLSHIDVEGSASQVDVSHKIPTTRTAVAIGTVKVSCDILHQIKENQLKKGDVLSVANVAAMLGSKRTADLIPLCHNIPVLHCNTQFDIDEAKCAVNIRCSVKTHSETGVEMEALTAVSCAALTIYDMCKAVSQEMQITDIQVVRKTGGKNEINRQKSIYDQEREVL